MAETDTRLLLARALRDIAPDIASEPRPHPTLRVGGIGRRRIDADKIPAIEATVRRIFALLRECADVALLRPQTARWFSGNLDCVAITPLAEGADRLIARAGGKEKWRLGAVLPFPQAEYEQTFDIEENAVRDFRDLLQQATLPAGRGIFVLDGKTAREDERNRSYRDCASAIIHRSDFVIAIVEHTSSLSQTGSSVRDAVALRVPLILVHPETPDRFRLVLGGRELADHENQESALAQAVYDIFPSTIPKENEPGSRPAIVDYTNEPVRCAVKPGDVGQDEASLLAMSDFEFSGPCTGSTHAPFWIRPFSGLNALFRKGLRKALRHGKGIKLPKLAACDVSTLSFDPETAKNFVRLFLHYHRADQVANAYAELQRSAYILQALLAMTVGVLSALDLVYPTNTYFSVIILALLLLIYGIVVVAERQDWQGRWIDYRLLAEVLRAGKALLVAGKDSPLASNRESIIKLNRDHWVSCHATDIFRSLKIAVPGRTLDPDPGALEKAHRYINTSYIGGQVRYHAITADYERKLGKILKGVSVIIAYLILGVAVANVAQKNSPIAELLFRIPSHSPMERQVDHILAMLLIILPAVAAVLVSLRSYNQFEVVSRRSSTMADELAGRIVVGRSFDSFRSFGEHALEAAQKILHDVEGWMDIFITKRMEN